MKKQGEEFPRVIVVMLRRPKSEATESRTDPLWEMGSFGTTGCHTRNLMNPLRLEELTGTRFAFAQGGPKGVRLVHVTPPVVSRSVRNGKCGEVRWDPVAMPLRYELSPCIVDNDGTSETPLLQSFIRGVNRHTWIAKFASAFRTRRLALAGVIGEELVTVYERCRTKHPEYIADTYVDALPWHPPLIESDSERRRKYREMTGAPSIGACGNAGSKNRLASEVKRKKKC
jgi:hypothetical protein